MHRFPNDASADIGTQGRKIRCSGLETVFKGIIPIAEKNPKKPCVPGKNLN